MQSIQGLFGQEFHIAAAAKLAIDQASEKDGQAFNIQYYKPSKEYALKLILRCAKATNYLSQANAGRHNSRRRKSITQKMDCPCKLKITRTTLESPWIINGFTSNNAAQHNHRYLPLDSYPRYRRKTLESRKAQVISMYNAGSRPAQIVEILHNQGDLDVIVTFKDGNYYGGRCG